MSRKIIGVTVGTQLPKPNFKQTDPTKGDYIKNKPDFDGLKSKVDTVSDLVGDTAVSEQIANVVDNTLSVPGKAADAKVVGDMLSGLYSMIATDDGNGIITLAPGSIPLVEEAVF